MMKTTRTWLQEAGCQAKRKRSSRTEDEGKRERKRSEERGRNQRGKPSSKRQNDCKRCGVVGVDIKDREDAKIKRKTNQNGKCFDAISIRVN